MMAVMPVTAFLLIALLSTSECTPIGDIGNTIKNAVSDAGKAVKKGAQDVGQAIAGFPNGAKEHIDKNVHGFVEWKTKKIGEVVLAVMDQIHDPILIFSREVVVETINWYWNKYAFVAIGIGSIVVCLSVTFGIFMGITFSRRKKVPEKYGIMLDDKY